jgi:hypothetical protein
MNESLYTSSDVISSNSSLRNLYQIGFNTKSLTKAVVNSINITGICNRLKRLVEEDELTIKACGPLLLGISRVYGKKVKLYLEELMTALDIKKKEPIDESLIKTARRKKKLLAGQIEDEATDIAMSSKRKGSMVSMSQMSHGLFNQLKERIRTPQRLNIDRLETPPMEVFRAGFPSSVQKNTFEEMKSYAEEGENFFKFISENTFSERPHDMDFDINIGDINYEQPLPSDLKFNETKSLLEEFKSKEFKDFKKLKPKKVDEEKLIKIGYDKTTDLDVEMLTEENVATVNPSELMSKFKSLLLNKLEVSNLDIPNEAHTFSEEHYLNDLSTTFANLDMKEFNIETFNEKLTKILEEEGHVAEINEDIKEDIEEPLPLNDDFVNQHDVSFNPEYANETVNLNIREKIFNAIGEDTPFLDLRESLEFNVAEIFYNMLVMAQNEEIEIQQTELFNNNCIKANRIII